ncbi:MAG TPA: radical SAM protein [Dehalococcoidia bacterium]|nr:radical SAM protein [Dehalococcoidia bacterium]
MSKNTLKDARYRLSRETGTVIKDWGGRLPVALVCPNSYYIGMSNLGIHTIYKLLNDYDNVVCERIFSEDPSKGGLIPSLSLESERPLSDFGVIAFSITYELDYFNVIKILKSSGLPIYTTDRDESHPLVIAGGPCITANPMPLAPFFDCLCIGEAEAILPNILPVLREGIAEKRDDLLQALGKIPGIYVPQANVDMPVKRQWLTDIDSFQSHSAVLTPDTELGNLYLVEAERGCGHGCLFCMVSTIFSPTRFRSVNSILEQAAEGLKYRKRIGLVGPAVSEHPQFEEILSGLHRYGAEVSVSSLRIKPLPESAVVELSKGKARMIALAPEAGSQRLRSLIKKGINEEDILRAMRKVAVYGIRQLKLYFMIGLPTETDEDIEEITRLTLKCREILESISPGYRITLSIAPFVPKAGTSFQRQPMEELNVLNNRVNILKKQLSPAGISIKADSPAWSRVQGTLARGDERLAEVLAGIENHTLSNWQKVLTQKGLEDSLYLREIPRDETLSWSMISE